MPQRICSTVAGLLCLWITVVGAQDDRRDATSLWELAIAAKGGRERLAAIHSFAIHEKTAFRNLMLRDIARGRVDQIVCALPDNWWEFLDYRPGKMGYSVTTADVRTGLGWWTSGGPARPFLRPATSLADRMRRLQYVYFLETSAVRPTPMRASRARLGFKAVDRIHAVFENDTIVVDLDVKTHLPVRVETVTPITLKPPRPGMTVPGDSRFIHELSEYHDVGGVQVPGRRDTTRARVEINPDYEPSIFTTPPSPDATMEAWRKN